MGEPLDTNEYERPEPKRWWLWAIWGVLFLALEGYALATKQRVVATLSAVIQWLVSKYRWLGIVIAIVLIWLALHWQAECFLGIC